MKAPAFWHSNTIVSAMLAPFAKAYAAASACHLRHIKPVRARVPVICVGNVTLGGAGKTPVALAIGQMLRDRGLNAFYLSRGYGGERTEPLLVNPLIHTAAEVGDEPLLLARVLPTVVATRRPDGAKLAAAYGAEMLIMDDGLQNPYLHKDLSLLVIDGTYGFGNGRVVPAGPLREPAEAAMARADAVIIVNPSEKTPAVKEGIPVLHARTVPDSMIEDFKGKTVVAFCGIAQPEKFFSLLEAHGVTLAQRKAFADHHPYSRAEIESLLGLGLPLVTTAKDKVRIPADLQQQITTVEISLEFEDKSAIDLLLQKLSPS